VTTPVEWKPLSLLSTTPTEEPQRALPLHTHAPRRGEPVVEPPKDLVEEMVTVVVWAHAMAQHDEHRLRVIEMFEMPAESCVHTPVDID
jgi:hypothetical protein